MRTHVSSTVHDDQGWWHGPVLERYLGDLLAAELGRMRPSRSGPRLAWDPRLPIGSGGLEADSLERLRLGEAVSQALDLPDGPDALGTVATLGEMAAEARRLLPQAGGGVAFLTSGSTGRPKVVRHDLRLLWQEVEHLASLVPGVQRILTLIPSQAIYGFLFTVLLPQRLGIPVMDLRDQRPGSLPVMARQGDLIVATPPTWASVSEAGWPADILGVTSGAPCPVETAETLRSCGLRLLEIYGSTETGGIGARNDELEPFRLFPYWEREGETRLRREADGAALSAELPDHVEWAGQDLLRPRGRRDGAVQVAGVNVQPDKVRAVLLAHPSVAEARVRLMRPDEGEWLKAFVVPREGAEPDDLPRALEDWTRTRLSAPERPRSITVGTALPMTSAGKPGDWFIEGA